MARSPVWSDVIIPILLISSLALQLQRCVSVTNRFTQLDECICPGHILTFECSILGNGVTVWQGSAIDCSLSSSNQILLSHSRFEGAIGSCNNGAIVASSIDVLPASDGTSDQCFISQLNIAVTDAMRNRTIECFHIQPNLQLSTVIGNTTLTFTTEPYPPPDNIHLISYSVDPNILTFAWDTLSSNCSTLNYTIISTNCGRCLSPASNASTVCTDVPIAESPCILKVQTDVCGRIAGIESAPIVVQFQVVDPPTPKLVAHFSCINQSLIVDINFNKTDNFNIADGFDGSATSYTLTYAESTSNEICGTHTIQASDCVGLICTHTLKINRLSPCLTSSFSSGVSITVNTANALGNGPSSDPVVLVIPECDVPATVVSSECTDGDSKVAIITTVSILITLLLLVSALTVFLVIVTIILLRRNARIRKELVKAKESSTYEEIDIQTFSKPAPIDTAGNISYCPVSRK